MTNNNENREHCKRIAESLERVTSGNCVICPHCGNTLELDDGETSCPVCGGSLIDEDGDPLDLDPCTLYEYLQDVYDIEYRIGSDGAYRSVRLMVACGGPNIYIDTAEKAVKLYWWTEYAEYPIDDDAVNAVDEWAEDLYECTKR